MHSLADKMGFGPKREYTNYPDGTFTVHVTPHAISGKTAEKSVEINTPEKVAGFQKWCNGDMIQDVLPMLTVYERAILIDGGAMFTE